MPDTFTISGDEIRFGPWTVGRLEPSMPATVRERVVELVEGIDARNAAAWLMGQE